MFAEGECIQEWLVGCGNFILIVSKLIWFSLVVNVLQLDRQTISIAIRFLKAKTPEQRAAVDLDTHYSKVQVLFILSCFCLFSEWIINGRENEY